MSNYPDGMTSADYDHVEGERMVDAADAAWDALSDKDKLEWFFVESVVAADDLCFSAVNYLMQSTQGQDWLWKAIEEYRNLRGVRELSIKFSMAKEEWIDKQIEAWKERE